MHPITSCAIIQSWIGECARFIFVSISIVKVLMTTLSLSAVAAACAASLVEAKGHDDKSASCKEDANRAVWQLHDAKAVVGDKRNCAVARSFYDGLVTGGWARGTASNYLSTFRKAVASGKPVTDWNESRKDAKGKDAKGKGKGKTKGSKALVDLFRPAFNHESGKSFQVLCAEIEARYNNAEFGKYGTMYDGFVDYFKAQGDEIAE